jgi:hypothetical protein
MGKPNRYRADASNIGNYNSGVGRLFRVIAPILGQPLRRNHSALGDT